MEWPAPRGQPDRLAREFPRWHHPLSRGRAEEGSGPELPVTHLPVRIQMSISRYVKELRSVVGSRLLLMPGVAAVIRNVRGEILLIRRADDGRWGLPAGAVDPGESPAAALVREVREETGLEVEPVGVMGVFGGEGFRHVYPGGDEAEYTVVVFECRVLGGDLHPGDGEALEFEYFAAEEMPALQVAYPRALFRLERGALPLF